MFWESVRKAQKENDSLLCIGLDPVPDRIPDFLKMTDEYVFGFNKTIIDNTRDLVCAYKPNLAYYLALGNQGLRALTRTIEYIGKSVPVILDAKFGDVSHSNIQYARTSFETLGADAVTVSPYVGFESLEPFLEYSEKGVIVLCLTSNPGYMEFQNRISGHLKLYEQVATSAEENWKKRGNVGIVVGATHPEDAELVRKRAPSVPFLMPGVGAQGGNLERSVNIGTTVNGYPPIVVSGRSIIYAGSDKNFGDDARQKAIETKKRINLAKKPQS